jgi:hypothetical protein
LNEYERRGRHHSEGHADDHGGGHGHAHGKNGSGFLAKLRHGLSHFNPIGHSHETSDSVD